MKILLLNSPYRVKISKDSRWPEYTKSGTLYYPFWLAYATSVIMERGNHKPLLLDAIAKKMSFGETIKKAEKFNPDLVVLETSTPTVHSDVKFADLVKERLGKDVKIAMSGTLASSMPFDVIKMSPSIDFILRGEFDFTVEDLANAIEKGSDLKKVLGITFRSNSSIYNTPPRPLVNDLDKIPFVSKAYKKFLNVFDYRYALARYPMLQTWSSRGCPARCNFCVDGNSIIILKNNNRLKILPIKDFIDKIIEKNGINIDGYEFADISNLNIRVFSDGKFVNVNKVSRIKKKKVLKINLDKGYYIKVSEDHLIPVKSKDGIKNVPAKDLKIGDKIIRVDPPRFENSMNKINLYREIIENVPKDILTDIYVHNLREYFDYLDKELKVLKEVKKKLKRQWLTKKILPINEFSKLITKYGIKEEFMENIEIGGKNILPVKANFEFTEDFMKLVGFFVAEGNYNKFNLVITCSDKEKIKTITNIIKSVFPKTYIYITNPTKKRGGQIIFGSKLIYILFRYILEIPEKAYNKRVPSIIFNLSENLMCAFLSGIFSGDGSYNERKIVYSTTSEVLAQQISTLLLALDISPSILEKKSVDRIDTNIKKKHALYECYIASWDDRQRFLEKIGFVDKRQDTLRKFQEYHKPKRVIFLEKLDVDTPKTVKELSYELDISEEMTRYFARRLNHSGFVLRKKINSGINRKYLLFLKKNSILKNNKKEVLKIKEIQVLDEEVYLYDMETENNYFFTNNILVHNCVYPQSFTMHQFRMRSPENVVDEMEYIHENIPQVKEIFFEDDTFPINQDRVIKICNEIKSRGLKDAGIVWSCNVRVQTKYETLKAMKDAGCRIVIVGYESGNQQVLNNIRKGATIREAKRFTLDAKRAGLRIFGCFMIGLSGDTKDSIMDTLKLAKEMNPDMAFFQQAVPFPGTEFYEWAKTNGYLVTEKWDDWLDENGQLRCLINYPWLSAEEIDKLRDRLMLSFYTNPKHIAQTILKNLHPYEAPRVALYAMEYLRYLMKRKLNPDGTVKGKLKENGYITQFEENFVGDNTIPS